MNVLFVCGQNRMRSPTAEQVFADWPGVETASAGLHASSPEPLSGEHVQWADVIFVMEERHAKAVRERHRKDLQRARVIVLGIPDKYRFMDPDLVALLRNKVEKHLPRG